MPLATGRPIVLSAPSGAGKSSIIEGVRSRVSNLEYSVSHTTRSPRRGEANGVHYHFVSKERFEKMIDEGAFAEWAMVYDNYYGTAYETLEGELRKGNDVILDLDPVGAKNIKKRFLDAVLIFVVPPSLEVLEDRLRGRRTDSEDTIKKRLEHARSEMREAQGYDYIVVNNVLATAIEEVACIIGAERCRTRYRLGFLKNQFGL
ncbi:MAG: guanylate kinase [Deltaproteobacteria bacterium]|nr:guanylate kinase [Deltaproteobacteria bacterium]MBW2083488.1 guanylate kinase [Deltaproteobacteria bacterium]